MTTSYLTEQLAQQHRTELRRAAGTSRLAALARCCSPSAWRRTARRAAQAVARLRTAARRESSATACCTA